MQAMDILPSNTNPCCLHMAHFHIHQCKASKYGKINYSSKKNASEASLARSGVNWKQASSANIVHT